MTTPASATAPPLGGPATEPTGGRGPTRRRRWARAGLLAAFTVVAVALLALSVASTRSAARALDPDDAGRDGTRALAQVLRQQGVRVEVVRSIAALEATRVDPQTTVVVGDVTYLGTAAAQRTAAHVADAQRLVVVEPGDLTLEDLGLPVQVVGAARSDLRAGCSSDLADPGDQLTAAATLYAPSSPGTSTTGWTSCYVPSTAPSAQGDSDSAGGEAPGAAVVVLPAGGDAPETVLLGSASALTNARITDGAHAALALRALGAGDHLVWYVPDVGDLDVPGPDGQRAGDPRRGVPEWFAPGVVLLGLVVIVYAFARGRRLGRLVTEPLPVVVRAAETTEARGRLYHRASDRDLAAGALRSGARTRLATRLGLPPSAAHADAAPEGAAHSGAVPSGLVDAVARSTGQPPAAVEALLHGPTPDTDRDLLLLAQRLADLEESVRPA